MPSLSTGARRRQPPRNFVALVALVALLSCCVAPAKPALAKTWRQLYNKEGVTVSAMDRPGIDLPVLRGTCLLRANLYLLLAIVDDLPRHPEWIHRLELARMIERPDPFHARAYFRFDFPWPVSDRDSVVQVVIERRWKPHHEVVIRFWRTVDARVPSKPGVVRIPRSKGFTRLRWMGPNQTHVVYQIDADPGGSLPRWMVRWLSQSLPLRVVRGLRRQWKRRSGSYAAFARRWDPRHAPQSDAVPGFVLPGVDMRRVPRPKRSPP